jgi:hypothetical protein
MKKICTKCQTEKDEIEFRFQNRKENKRAPWCKKCFSKHEREKWKTSSQRRESNKENNRIRKVRNSQFLWDYLTQHPCEDCGEKDPVVLTFNHKDRETKGFNVSESCSRSYSIERIKEEIGKCEVLCANCHMRKTAKQMNWHKKINKRGY